MKNNITLTCHKCHTAQQDSTPITTHSMQGSRNDGQGSIVNRSLVHLQGQVHCQHGLKHGT